LDKFFQQWIYGEYFPRYSSGWLYKPVDNGYNVKVEIKQIQNNTGLFWMPIDVNIATENDSSVYVAWDSLQTQTFEFLVNDKPFNVDLDTDDWILKETTKHLLTPNTENVQLNNPFQNPDSGVLNITASTFNPDSLNISLSAIIESNDQSQWDSIGLFDDGLHSDGTADDGIFGGYWQVADEELYYNIHMLTHDLDSGYINYQPKLSNFTTIGPVSLEDYITANGDTVTQPGEDFFVKLILKNNSTAHTIPNISADLATSDTCIVEIIQDNANYGTLSPGEKSTTEGVYLIKTNPLCQTPHSPLVEIQIKSNDNLFWIDTLRFGIITKLDEVSKSHPVHFGLNQNYPNPFNSSTVISYQLPKSSNVDLSVYNLLGQKVATLVSQYQQAGRYDVAWDATGFNSGIYFYRLKTPDGFKKTRKLVLLK